MERASKQLLLLGIAMIVLLFLSQHTYADERPDLSDVTMDIIHDEDAREITHEIELPEALKEIDKSYDQDKHENESHDKEDSASDSSKTQDDYEKAESEKSEKPEYEKPEDVEKPEYEKPEYEKPEYEKPEYEKPEDDK